MVSRRVSLKVHFWSSFASMGVHPKPLKLNDKCFHDPYPDILGIATNRNYPNQIVSGVEKLTWRCVSSLLQVGSEEALRLTRALFGGAVNAGKETGPTPGTDPFACMLLSL